MDLFRIFLQTIVAILVTRIIVGIPFPISAMIACAEAGTAQQKWAASWTTAMSGPLKKIDLPPGLPPAMIAAVKAQLPQREFDFAMPDGRADDQSFRMIVKPDLWGDTIRLRFSNMAMAASVDLAALMRGRQ